MKMKWLLSLASLCALISVSSAACDACLDGFCHYKHLIVNNSISHSIAVDRSTNILYFSTLHDDHYASDACAYNLNDYHLEVISNVNTAVAVDQKSHDIYVALTESQPGIYKYDPNSNKYTPYAVPDVETVVEIYCKNKLIYFTIMLESGIYVYDARTKSYEVIKAIDNLPFTTPFVVDKRDDVFYVEPDRYSPYAYRLKKNDARAMVIANGNYTLSTDASDSAVLVDDDRRGVYRLNYATDRFDLIGAIGGDTRTEQIVFDRDNNMVVEEYSELASNLYHYKRGTDMCKIKTDKETERVFIVADEVETKP